MSKDPNMAHIEKSVEEGMTRRQSSVTEIAHTEAPVWQLRKTYTRQGRVAMQSAKCTDADQCDRVYGHIHVKICVLVCSVRHYGRVALRLRSRSRVHYVGHATVPGRLSRGICNCFRRWISEGFDDRYDRAWRVSW